MLPPSAFEMDPKRVDGLPILAVDPVTDYAPLFEDAEFSIDWYQESAGWAERVPATFAAVAEAIAALTDETGESAATSLGMEAHAAVPALPATGRRRRPSSPLLRLVQAGCRSALRRTVGSSGGAAPYAAATPQTVTDRNEPGAACASGQRYRSVYARCGDRLGDASHRLSGLYGCPSQRSVEGPPWASCKRGGVSPVPTSLFARRPGAESEKLSAVVLPIEGRPGSASRPARRKRPPPLCWERRPSDWQRIACAPCRGCTRTLAVRGMANSTSTAGGAAGSPRLGSRYRGLLPAACRRGPRFNFIGWKGW